MIRPGNWLARPGKIDVPPAIIFLAHHQLYAALETPAFKQREESAANLSPRKGEGA